ncbi:MAG TPA: hypothetical protein VG317_18255 [Pseudonocardiaceae bacterium]|jgi:uncharacterized protein YukE|nr:hypothetical protein [Pseudonocardiaceae bacterium]
MPGGSQFRVEPSYLKGYSGQIDSNAGHLSQIAQYLSANANQTNEMQGLLQSMAGCCAELLSWQLGVLGRMQPELADTGKAVDQTASNYTHTDQRNAALLDEAYSSGRTPNSGGPRAS